jgi:hypothetical protein
MDSSLPTDLTDWVALILFGLFCSFLVWEYRRLANRGGRGRKQWVDSDDDSDEGSGDGGGDGGGD